MVGESLLPHSRGLRDQYSRVNSGIPFCVLMSLAVAVVFQASSSLVQSFQLMWISRFWKVNKALCLRATGVSYFSIVK
jgi:hypothetical protein